MDNIILKYAFILCSCYCVVAQYGYYPQPHYDYDGDDYYETRYYRPRFIQQSFRRSDSCSQYPDSTCMFTLLCIIGGGVSRGTCPGTLRSTCCAPRSSLPSQVPQTFYQRPTAETIPNYQPVRTERPKETTTVPYESSYNKQDVTYCGIIKAKPQSRIIGGNDAMYGEFPWQAHIKLKRQQCGGVLLNKYYVLTAAHCIYQIPMNDIIIQLGLFDIQDHSRQDNPPQTFAVVEKKIHPRFQFQAAHPDRYDVALLKLNKAARYQDNVLPICLPKRNATFLGQKGLITGWGKTDSGLSNRYGTRLLQKVDVPIISNQQCELWHEEKGIDITISPEMLCAGYENGQKDACVGDSGGPLIVNAKGRWVVVGLVSAGFGCAQSKQPGIYHRVPLSVDWLRESISH